MTEITRKCLCLDRKDRERLVKILQESLTKKGECDEKRFKVLYDIATELFGHGILTSSRDFNLVLGRRFIAWQMHSEGYSHSAIGRHLVRHHASVIHMLKMMEDVFAYDEIFQLEKSYWILFQRKLREHENDKRTAQDS